MSTLETLRYDPRPGCFDEAVGPGGDWRRPWSALARALGDHAPAVLAERQRQADRLLDAEGAGHLVHELALERWSDRRSERRGRPAPPADLSRPWRLDPLPFVVDGAEFAALAAAATQRMRLIEQALADLHGPRTLIRAGVVPGRDLWSSLAYLPAPGGPGEVGRWLVHYALDLARDAGGTWRVVQDVTDAPAGLGYALLGRAVLARLLPDALRLAGAAPIHDHSDALRRALTAAAPRGRRSPRCVVLTAGPRHPTYVEHSYLATQLGYHLAEGADLVMRQGRLWLRALEGLEPVDVVYRRVEDHDLDPLQSRTAQGGGVPGLVWAARSGGVTLANVYGSGVGAATAVVSALPAVAAHFGSPPLELEQLDIGAELATAPVFDGARPDPLAATPVVLRLQLVAAPDGVSVMQGAVGRVLLPGDDPREPTAELAKDVWVVGGPPAPARLPLRVAPPPQVDFGGSVPRRVADALYWLGRAAERAEVAARTVREVASRLDRDPMLPSLADGAWGTSACALLWAAQAVPHRPAEEGRPLREQVDAAVRAASNTAAAQIGSLVQEATSVREYLSTTTGRVLGRLATVRAELMGVDPAADDLDMVLVDLAALAGLATESTVRGPSWRFLDLGRRLERALAVLGAVEAALAPHGDAIAFQAVAEVVLSANESLVAYRRRYRSDIDIDAVLDLLVRDDANPRGLAFQLDRLREHVAALAWPAGSDLVQQASLGALTPIEGSVVAGRRIAVDSLVLATRGPLLQLSDAIALRWFADPVDPRVVPGR